MITPTDGSSRARSNASDISITVWGRNALRTSGRLIVIFAMPSPDVSYRMSSYSPAGVHSTFAMGRHTTHRSMEVPAWLPRAAVARPDRVAVRAPDARLTYAELLDAARALVGELTGGRPLAVEAAPTAGFAVTLHACLLAGVPL